MIAHKQSHGPPLFHIFEKALLFHFPRTGSYQQAKWRWIVPPLLNGAEGGFVARLVLVLGLNSRRLKPRGDYLLPCLHPRGYEELWLGLFHHHFTCHLPELEHHMPSKNSKRKQPLDPTPSHSLDSFSSQISGGGQRTHQRKEQQISHQDDEIARNKRAIRISIEATQERVIREGRNPTR